MPISISPATIAIAAGEELQGIFGDAIETVRKGEADYLASGEPQSISGKVSQAAGRSACRVYAQGTVNLSGRVAERYERACRPYLNSISPGNGLAIASPFTGGQCQGVRYSYQYRIISADGVAGAVTTVPCTSNRRGPISVEREDQGENGVRWYIVSFSETGVRARSLVASSNARVRLDVFNVQRCDGGSTTCGNPPPVVEPPRPIADPQPPPFRFSPTPDVNVDVDVTIGPTGNITFNIGTGPITIDPFGGDDGGGGPDPGPDPGPPPGDVGEPSAPVETGPGGSGPDGSTGPGAGAAEGVAPEGSELVGIRMQLLVEPSSRTKYTDVVRRGACYVYMGVPGLLDHDPAGAMITDDQFIFAEREGLTAWRVRANKGYSFRITPYYRQVT